MTISLGVAPPAAPVFTWEERLVLDGVAYPANRLRYTTREGVEVTLIAIQGLPPMYLDGLLAASQMSDAALAWRIGAQLERHEVTPDVLERARERYIRDQAETRNRFLTVLVERSDGSTELAGAIGARTWIGPNYESRWWLAGGRLIVVPELVGLGFGKFVQMYGVSIGPSTWGKPLLGGFYGSDSPSHTKMLRALIAKGWSQTLPLGAKVLHGRAIPVFVLMLPEYHDWFLQLARAIETHTSSLPPAWRAVAPQLCRVWRGAGTVESTSDLGALFDEYRKALEEGVLEIPELDPAFDFLGSTEAMGVFSVPPAMIAASESWVAHA